MVSPQNSVRICPSVLNADHSNLESEIAKVANADLLHLDIMDGNFVPNTTFSLEESRKIISSSAIPVDAHLMIADPDQNAVLYADAGCASVTFHYEASNSPSQTLKAIRSRGARSGLAIKPSTPFSEVVELLEYVDMLLLMTVEPGRGGQKFMYDQLPRIREAALLLSQLSGEKKWLQVDGGITVETIALAAASGADTFVAGSAIYRSDDPSHMVSALRERAQLARNSAAL